MSVTVFAKPHCVQCEATKRQLRKQGIDFTTVDLTADPDALLRVQQAGFKQAPVVFTDDASWSGYRPDMIKQLAEHKVLV